MIYLQNSFQVQDSNFEMGFRSELCTESDFLAKQRRAVRHLTVTKGSVMESRQFAPPHQSSIGELGETNAIVNHFPKFLSVERSSPLRATAGDG